MGDFRRDKDRRKADIVRDVILTILLLGSVKILLEIMDVFNKKP